MRLSSGGDVSWVTPAIVYIHNESPTFHFPTCFSGSVGVNSIEPMQVHVNIQYEVVQPCLRKEEQAALSIDLLVVQRRQLINLVWQQVHIPMIACSTSDPLLAQSLA